MSRTKQLLLLHAGVPSRLCPTEPTSGDVSSIAVSVTALVLSGTYEAQAKSFSATLWQLFAAHVTTSRLQLPEAAIPSSLNWVSASRVAIFGSRVTISSPILGSKGQRDGHGCF
jgi:hypothetical protein